MRVRLDSKVGEDQIIWCFKNLEKFTWGVKSMDGYSYFYFDKPSDAEKFINHWGSEILT